MKAKTDSQTEAMNAIDKFIGNRIRVRRTLLAISQLELANLLHVSFQQVQKYERGTNRIAGSRIWQLARVLNIPVNYFFDGIENYLEANGYENVIEYAKDCFFDSCDNYHIMKQPYDKQIILRELVDSFVQIKNSALADGILNLVKQLSEVKLQPVQPIVKKQPVKRLPKETPKKAKKQPSKTTKKQSKKRP